MVRYVWECHFPAGVEEPRYLVQFLREVAHLLQLPQEGKDDERALDELSCSVQCFGDLLGGGSIGQMPLRSI